MAVSLVIVDTFERKGVTYYIIQVNNGGAEWLLEARYSEFEVLDQRLSGPKWKGTRRGLPPKDTLHVRKTWSSDRFNSERMDGLKRYLDHLSGQLISLADCPPLADFCEGGGEPEPEPGRHHIRSVAESISDLQPSSRKGSIIGFLPFLRHSQADFDTHEKPEKPATQHPVPPLYHSHTSQQCFKCSGLGFYHDSVVSHDEDESVKCFFCQVCDCCNGAGDIPKSPRCVVCDSPETNIYLPDDGKGPKLDACFKCGGIGFTHESVVDHDGMRGKRCFWCKTCSVCGGRGCA